MNMTRAAATSIANALTGIADRLAMLAPSHRDPERYHVEKNELVHELHKLACTLNVDVEVARHRPIVSLRQRRAAT